MSKVLYKQDELTMGRSFAAFLDPCQLLAVNCFGLLCFGASLCCPCCNAPSTRQYLKKNKYIYSTEATQYLKIEELYNKERREYVTYTDLEAFDCELSHDDKVLITKIKGIMAGCPMYDRKDKLAALSKEVSREIAYDGFNTVELPLNGPERPKIAPIDKSIRDVRNYLMYDVNFDRVFGNALLSESEIQHFTVIRDSLKQSALAKSWCCMGNSIQVLTYRHCFTSCCWYSCCYKREIETIRGSIPSGADMEILEHAISGRVFMRLYAHDYTQYGSHKSGVTAEVPVESIRQAQSTSGAVAPMQMDSR